MEEFLVEFYEKCDGSHPAEDFIRSLDKKMMARKYGIIGILEEKGNLLREPYSKHIEDGIFEIRAKFGSDISRVLYFFYIGRRIILTNGFIKKTQKTPITEIALAKKYRKDFISRMEGQNENL